MKKTRWVVGIVFGVIFAGIGNALSQSGGGAVGDLMTIFGSFLLLVGVVDGIKTLVRWSTKTPTAHKDTEQEGADAQIAHKAKRENPLEKAVWFRLTKVVYIGIFVLWALGGIVAIYNEALIDGVSLLAVGLVVAILIRKAFYYVVLGNGKDV